jgi:hypothetical protein
MSEKLHAPATFIFFMDRKLGQFQSLSNSGTDYTMILQEAETRRGYIAMRYQGGLYIEKTKTDESK